MSSKNSQSQVIPSPLPYDAPQSQKKAPSCNSLPCTDLNTGELTTVGEWALSCSQSAKGGLSFIEQVHATSCIAPNRPMLKAINYQTKAAIFFRPRCKMWNCPSCAKANSDLWIMRVVHATEHFFALGYDVNFVTVTSHEKLNARQSLEVLPDDWKRLSMRWRRKVGSSPYVIIPELHKDGRVHLHGIMMSSVGTRWWKDNARSCGMGYQNEEKPIRSCHYAGFYVGKYLSKQMETNKYKKGFHRVRTSFHYPKQPPLPRDENWHFESLPSRDSLQDATRDLQQNGYVVVLANHRDAWGVLEELSKQE